MAHRATKEAQVPVGAPLDELRALAAGCTACHLHELGTATVFGEGPAGARMMMVGEMPGDREDVEGHPFVGPAGRVLDRALAEAGIPRGDVYVTNAVKHFKWVARGPRRIHDTPNERERVACRPWLAGEIAAVAPGLVVRLGATAARSVIGKDFRVTRDRGRVFEDPGGGPPALGTLHPSAVLRGPPERREELLAGVIDDLRAAASFCGAGPAVADHLRTA